MHIWETLLQSKTQQCRQKINLKIRNNVLAGDLIYMDNEHRYLKHTLKNKLMLVFILSQLCLKSSLPLHGSSSLNDLTSSLPHFWFCPTLAAPLLLLPFPYCNSWCKWGPFWGCLRGKYTAHWFAQTRWVLWNPLKWVSNTGTKLEYWIGNTIVQSEMGIFVCSAEKHRPSVIQHKPRPVLVSTYFKEKPQTCPNYCIDVQVRARQMGQSF